jgi:hypothetical protein
LSSALLMAPRASQEAVRQYIVARDRFPNFAGVDREDDKMGKPRVLIVDDDEQICRLLEATLSSWRMTTKSITNPLLVMDHLRKTFYNLVLLDIVMPEMSGLDLTHSFEGTVGIVGVNQAEGNLNQQANVLGVGLALSPEVVVLGDATLAEVHTDNTLTPGPAGPRADIISTSFADFRGIAQIAQSSGDLNAIGNFLALSFSVVNVQ